MSEFKFPKNLKEIGDSAFYNCENTKMNFDDINKCKIKNYAFYNCKNLEGDFSLIKDNNNYFIRGMYGDYTFYNCENLTGELYFLSMNDNQMESFKNTFRGSGITKVKAYNASILEYMFSDCKKLKEIDVTNLASSDFPNVIFQISKGAFKNCISLEKVYVNCVKLVDSEAFWGCKNIKDIEIIGIDDAFGERISRIVRYYFETEILKILKFSNITIVNYIDDKIKDRDNDGINDDVVINWK
jgi:hypothetical protein